MPLVLGSWRFEMFGVSHAADVIDLRSSIVESERTPTKHALFPFTHFADRQVSELMDVSSPYAMYRSGFSVQTLVQKSALPNTAVPSALVWVESIARADAVLSIKKNEFQLTA
jgi:hypothetical protein